MTIQRVNKSIHRHNPIIKDTDKKILYFLWRHKISTFEALRVLFYPNLAPDAAYYKLCRLRGGGYLEVQPFNGTKRLAWFLSPRGFQFLQANGLPELKSKSYKPQSHYHDLLITSALLGDWRLSPPSRVKIVSEQELQNTELLFLPDELRDDLEHRPDGLWVFNSGNEGFAVGLEVETSVKSNVRYEKICSYYANELFFKNIIWIVEDFTHGLKILNCSDRSFARRKGLHLIIDKSDYLEKGWDCNFLNESIKGSTLAEYLNTLAGVKTGNKISARPVYDGCTASANLNRGKNDIFLNLAINTVKFTTLESRRKL